MIQNIRKRRGDAYGNIIPILRMLIEERVFSAHELFASGDFSLVGRVIWVLDGDG